MDHVVYLDHKAKELLNMILGKKNMIVRGAMGIKIPYDKVFKNDLLYFVENKGELVVKAKAIVEDVYFSNKLSREDSFTLLDQHQSKLLLNTALKKRFAGKRYITLITLKDFAELKFPFEIDNSTFSSMDDWLMVKNIDCVRVKQEA
ncbi:MAG: hypothetical protein AAGA77_16820 [Bacteroidota bacterium]